VWPAEELDGLRMPGMLFGGCKDQHSRVALRPLASFEERSAQKVGSKVAVACMAGIEHVHKHGSGVCDGPEG